jgi:hypothetical protein
MLIAIVNQSSLVTNAQVQIIAKALQVQMNLHFAPAWDCIAPTITFYADATKVPGYAWIMYMIDNDSQVAGALGYHEENADKIVAYVMAEPILSNGGTVYAYDASNPSQYTVSATTSHECLEMYNDRFAGTFCTGPTNSSGSNLYCFEMADPVEDQSYAVSVDGYQVAVSNFIYPSWFNPQATVALNMPFDYLKTLKGPFQMTAGGYIITATLDNEGQVTAHHIFGKNFPAWRQKQVKSEFYRR